MSRPATRTDQIDPVVWEQLKEYLSENHRTLKSFQAQFLPDISYPAFYHAVTGNPATPEMLQEIDDALQKAQWREIWADRTTCPHCKGPLH